MTFRSSSRNINPSYAAFWCTPNSNQFAQCTLFPHFPHTIQSSVGLKTTQTDSFEASLQIQEQTHMGLTTKTAHCIPHSLQKPPDDAKIRLKKIQFMALLDAPQMTITSNNVPLFSSDIPHTQRSMAGLKTIHSTKPSKHPNTL